MQYFSINNKGKLSPRLDRSAYLERKDLCNDYKFDRELTVNA